MATRLLSQITQRCNNFHRTEPPSRRTKHEFAPSSNRRHLPAASQTFPARRCVLCTFAAKPIRPLVLVAKYCFPSALRLLSGQFIILHFTKMEVAQQGKRAPLARGGGTRINTSSRALPAEALVTAAAAAEAGRLSTIADFRWLLTMVPNGLGGVDGGRFRWVGGAEMALDRWKDSSRQPAAQGGESSPLPVPSSALGAICSMN